MIDIQMILGAAAGAGFLGSFILLLYAKKKTDAANDTLNRIHDQWKHTKRDIENERREATLKIKDEIYKKRSEFDLELKRDRLDLDRLQNKVNVKFEALEKKEQQIDEIRQEVQRKERDLSRAEDSLRIHENKLKNIYNELVAKLERTASMSRDEARQALFDTLDAEVKLTNQKWIAKVEDEARQVAKEKANKIVVTAMQRYTSDAVAIHSSGVVHLPNEEMKGRIIGKEGRNIKSLEMATGMEFVIGETPEIITISGFNTIRREIAKRTLECSYRKE